jgi:hypothetical protein
MPEIYRLRYKFRIGYSAGFNEGLMGHPNENVLPEEAWKAPELLTIKNYQRATDTKVKKGSDHYFEKELTYYKIGFNWGFLHGSEQRDELADSFPEARFERIMAAFANCIKVLFLEVNRNMNLGAVMSIDPDEELRSRLSIINEFLEQKQPEHFSKAFLDSIKNLLAENRFQKALDEFSLEARKLKDIEAYSAALSIKSDFIKLRNASKYKSISKEEYRERFQSLGKEIYKCISST